MALPCPNPFPQFVPLSFRQERETTHSSTIHHSAGTYPHEEVVPPRFSPLSYPLLPVTNDATYIADAQLRGDGKLPNRTYYPSSYHQQQFDSMASNSFLLEERESTGLNSLAGGVNDTPRYSMPVLIECAILGSPQQKLTYGELRITLKMRFRHFQREEDEGSKSWERTLMQNLSKKERFMIIERASYQASLQGGYWTINPNVPPYNHNPKRTSVKRSQKSTAFMRVSPIDTAEVSRRHMYTDTPPESHAELGGLRSLFPSITAASEYAVPRGSQTFIRLPLPQPNPREARITSPRRWKLVTGHELTK